MADFFFFTEPDKLHPQTADQAFGPIDENQYRVGNMFTATSSPKAFAVTKGQVLLQPTIEGDKINILLKPTNQPINGLKVKYFLYRGLQKSEFIQSNPSDNNELLVNNSENTSEFIKEVWREFNNLNDNPPNPEFLASWIGYNLDSQLPNLSVDSYFYINEEGSEGTYQLPLVTAGTQLGVFTANSSFEIILDEGSYETNLTDSGFLVDFKYVRASNGILDVNLKSENTSIKQYREAIYKFIDPAAYYGQAVVQKHTVKSRNEDVTKESLENEIYDDVLQNFYTKNNFYLYITSWRGRSYNFYKNINVTDEIDLLKIKNGSEEIVGSTFQTMSWPLLIFASSQTNETVFNDYRIKLRYEESSICYKRLGILTGTESSFLIDEDLIPEEEGEEFSKDIHLQCPSIGATEKVNISSIAWLYYSSGELLVTQENNEEGSTSNKLSLSPIQELFRPIGAASLFKTSDLEPYNTSLVGHDLRIIPLPHFNDSPVLIAENKISYDHIKMGNGEEVPILERVTYESINYDLLDSNSLYVANTSGTKQRETASIEKYHNEFNNFHQLLLPHYIGVQPFTDGNQLVNGLTIQLNETNGLPSKLLLGLCKDENEYIISKVNEMMLRNSSLMLSSNASGNQFISSEGIIYYVFTIDIIGELPDGQLKVFTPDKTIKVYSLDLKCFFSATYSEFIPERIFSEQFDLIRDDLTIDN